jgi:co-chaperonin GroES (HSP10)
MRALGQYILVQPIVVENKLASGLLRTEEAKYVHGKVISVGEQVPEIKIGDELVFSVNSGHDVKVSQIAYRTIRYSDVFLICD